MEEPKHDKFTAKGKHYIDTSKMSIGEKYNMIVNKSPICARREFSEPEKKEKKRWRAWRAERDEQRKADAIKALREVGKND
jgi:hypothetical protein